MEYEFCPKCAASLELKKLKEIEPERLVCIRCGFVFYLGPSVAVGAIVPLDGGIALLKRGIEPGHGKWVFPGGYVDRGETLPEAVVRETREEVGLDVHPVRLLNAYSYPGRPIILVAYLTEARGGTLQAADEALEVRVVSPREIPWSELAFPSTHDVLRDYVAGLGVDVSGIPRPKDIFRRG